METISEKIARMGKEADESWGKLYYHVLPKIIKERQYKSCIEVGVAWAGHAEAMIKAGITNYRGIDPYTPYSNGFSDGGKDFTQEDYDALREFAYDRLASLSDSCKIWLTATGIQRHHFDIPVDLIFLDGDHSYEVVVKEIPKAWEMVKKGGVLSGHDYNPEAFPGVVKAVDDFVRIHNLKDQFRIEDGYVWIIEKC